MSDKRAVIFERDGITRVATEYGELATGLLMPDSKNTQFPLFAASVVLYSMDEARKAVESDEFAFGRKLFDSTWVTYQNGFGSCAAYGGSSALAKARVLRGLPRVDLSGDYLYSLVNGGRDQGSLLERNMKAIVDNGVCKRETVKLGEIYRNKYDTKKADEEAARFKGFKLHAVPDEQSVVTALARRIPVVMAIHVNGSWRNFDRDDVLAPCNGPGNHCEHLDDIKYDTKRGCFLFRKATSHGKDYSGDGYCWTTWKDHYRVSSQNHMFYAVASTLDDPQGDNPPEVQG
jgi:hypothetical protein